MHFVFGNQFTQLILKSGFVGTSRKSRAAPIQNRKRSETVENCLETTFRFRMQPYGGHSAQPQWKHLREQVLTRCQTTVRGSRWCVAYIWYTDLCKACTQRSSCTGQSCKGIFSSLKRCLTNGCVKVRQHGLGHRKSDSEGLDWLHVVGTFSNYHVWEYR